MTLNKTKGFAVSLVSLGLLAAGMSAPIANAAQVDATIDAIDNCAWQISTGSGQFALTNTNKYVGDALILTAATTYDVILGLAGTNEAPNAVALDSLTTAECSFYNLKADEGITVTLSGTAFDAKYGATYDTGIDDEDMDISFATSSLMMSGTVKVISDVAQCHASYFDKKTFSSTAINTASPTLETMNSLAADDLPNIIDAGGIDAAESDYKAVCAQALSLSIQIPRRDNVPAGAGQAYYFEGPTLTIAKSSD